MVEVHSSDTARSIDVEDELRRVEKIVDVLDYGNILIDALAGIIPVLGDVFDVVFRPTGAISRLRDRS